jgi:hypothetical protein
MESYEKEWLAGEPILLAILHCVGLFDRPASGDCLKALRARPTIPGLTEALVGRDDDRWRHAVARLRESARRLASLCARTISRTRLGSAGRSSLSPLTMNFISLPVRLS